jgi:TolB-like protein
VRKRHSNSILLSGRVLAKEDAVCKAQLITHEGHIMLYAERLYRS